MFLFFFWAGNIFTKNILSRLKTHATYDYKTWFDKPEMEGYINLKTLMLFVLIFSIILVLGLFVYGGLNSFRSVLSNSSIAPEEYRRLRAESGVNGWISVFYAYVTTAIGRIVGFVYLGYAVTRKKTGHSILAFLYLLLLLVSQLANLSKTGFVLLLLQIVILLLLIYKVKFNFLKMIFGAIILLIILIPIFIYSTDSGNVSVALKTISYRVFEEPNRVLAMYIENWPDKISHKWGMNIRLIHQLFETAPFYSSDVILGGKKLGSTFNAIFLGDAWVDFSYMGIVIESFFIGAYLAVIDFWVFRKNNIMTKAMFAGLLLSMFSLSSIALLATMVTFGLVSIPVMVYLLRIKY